MKEIKASMPLLGRDKTLEALRKYMDFSDRSKGSLVIINGEAGIGKTAVVRKMEEEAREKGWAVMSSECIVGKGGDPYLPIITAIKGYFEYKDQKKDGHKVPTLPVGLMGATAHEETVEGWRTVSDLKNDRERMFENVLDTIRDALTTSPVLFIIDDLHWAEISALQLLYYIVRSTAHEKVLVLGTYRTEELEGTKNHHPLHEVLTRAKGENLLATMDLKPLNEHDTARLVNALAPVKVPAALIKRIYQETGGNPFFIKEFLRDIQISGKLVSPSLVIPNSVSLLIRNRLKGLEKEHLEVLQTGAVLGQQFNYDLLMGVAGIDEVALVNALDGLIGYKVLEERTSGQAIIYEFTHSLVREVVYEGLSAARKRMVHAKAGEHIEKMFQGRLEQAVYQLAYHFSRTSLLPKAFKYTAMAGLVSYEQMAMEEARQNLEEALELLKRLGPTEVEGAKEVELLCALGRVQNFLGNTQEALDCLSKALDLAPDASIEKAVALRYIADVYMEGGIWKKAIAIFKDAIGLSEKLNDPEGLAECYHGLTWLAVELGDHDYAMKYSEKGITEARKAGNKYLLGKILIDLGNLYNMTLEDDKSLYYYEEALKVLDHKRHLDQLARAYNNIGDLYLRRGEYGLAMDNFENCTEVARVVGAHRDLIFGQMNIGVTLGKLGKNDEAIDKLNQVFKEFERMGDPRGIAMVYISLGIIERDAKNFKVGEEHLKKAISICEKSDFDILLALAVTEYGILLKRSGNKAEALEQLERALKLKKAFDDKTTIGDLDTSLKELLELKG